MTSEVWIIGAILEVLTNFYGSSCIFLLDLT